MLRTTWLCLLALLACLVATVLTVFDLDPANTFRVDTLLVDNNATVSGNLAVPTMIYSSASTLALVGTVNDAAIGPRTLVRTTTGLGPIAITGMDSTGRVDGSMVWVQSPTNSTISYNNEGGGSLPANRIDTPNALTWSTTAGGYTLFSYNTNISRWQLMTGGTAIFATLTTQLSGATTFNAQLSVGTILVVGVQGTTLSAGLPTVTNGTLATGASNWSGAVTGIGANTSTVITYSAAFAHRSFCIVRPQTGAQIMLVTTTGAAVTINCIHSTTGVAQNCVDLFYTCAGN